MKKTQIIKEERKKRNQKNNQSKYQVNFEVLKTFFNQTNMNYNKQNKTKKINIKKSLTQNMVIVMKVNMKKFLKEFKFYEKHNIKN